MAVVVERRGETVEMYLYGCGSGEEGGDGRDVLVWMW